TIDIVASDPAALHRGGEESCWKKIRRLDKATFEEKCPAYIKDAINAEWQRSNNATPSRVDFSSRDRFSAKSAQKLPLRDAVQKARDILTTNSDEITTNIKLEEIREACGMSGYDWERKIIKPLKRDLEGDRFKLELLGLLQIDDSVERIRQQALLAPKYQMSSSLIEKAMSAMKQRTQTPESKALDLDELFDLESEGLSWIIPGLLPEKETIVLAGAPKAGKTLLAIDAAYAVATGESYFLGEATIRGKVLLVSTDESAKSTKTKLINRGFRRCDKDSIKVLPTWDITQMGTLETLLEDFRPDLVIIDSLRRINKGCEISENSAEFADAIYTLKETLERYGAAGILIHHTNKDREALGVHRLRGSSAIAGAVWGTWQLDQIPKPDPNNKKKLIVDPKDPTRTLSVFARDIEGQQLLIELNPENNSWTKAGEVGESEEAQAERDTLRTRILKLLGIPTHATGLSGSEIIDRLDADEVDKRSVYNCLNRMVSKRIITSKPAPGDKRYNIYSLPNCHTPEHSSVNCHTQESSPPPPSPTPTDPVGDYYAETVPTVGLENSHQNSHHPKKNSHHPNVENPTDDYSNADLEGDSEIVITFDPERGGRGEKIQADVTVDQLELSHMQPMPVEQTAFTSESEAIAPTSIDHDVLIDQCETY
ncbi:MAG TPA: AAA family ATPase, partial [Oculatellaceae cyanobacterium]